MSKTHKQAQGLHLNSQLVTSKLLFQPQHQSAPTLESVAVACIIAFCWHNFLLTTDVDRGGVVRRRSYPQQDDERRGHCHCCCLLLFLPLVYCVSYLIVALLCRLCLSSSQRATFFSHPLAVQPPPPILSACHLYLLYF